MESPVFFIALLGGVLPALLWLAFWLLEDRCQPEPKRYIVLCFFAGAAVVYLALQLERYACTYLVSGGSCTLQPPLLILFVWAAIEEAARVVNHKDPATTRDHYLDPQSVRAYLE